MYAQADAAIAKGLALIADGARILDIGGESTRPGAQPVAADEEIARIMPVLEVFRDVDVALSVDTRHAAVMKAALDAGADIINDISGFRDPQAQNLVAAHPNCGVCIMHMQGDPSTMQIQPEYTDIVSEVKHYLVRQAQTLEALGIAKQRICIDPGFGFGKSLEQNFQLLAQLKNLTETEYAVLVGVSRKSMIGMTTQKSVKERVFGSVAAAVCGLERGASILRVHDVGPTLDALSIWQAVQHGVISE